MLHVVGASWKRPGLSFEPRDSYDKPHDEPLQIHVPADGNLIF